MWLGTPNHLVAPPNLAPPDGVRYKVIKFLKKLTWIILYNKKPRKMLIWSPDEGGGGSAKGDCFVHL